MMHKFETLNGAWVLVELSKIMSVWPIHDNSDYVGITLSDNVAYKVRSSAWELEKLLTTPREEALLRDLETVRKCFEAAEIEGWSELLEYANDSRLHDVWNRRLLYAYNYVCQVAPPTRAG